MTQKIFHRALSNEVRLLKSVSMVEQGLKKKAAPRKMTTQIESNKNKQKIHSENNGIVANEYKTGQYLKILLIICHKFWGIFNMRFLYLFSYFWFDQKIVC